jgi:hypothetical protein
LSNHCRFRFESRRRCHCYNDPSKRYSTVDDTRTIRWWTCTLLERIDIFSFGVLLYEIVTGEKPLQCCELSHFQLFTKVMAGNREKISDAVEQFIRGLISRYWEGNPGHRLTFLEICYELQAHRFKVFNAVDSQEVWQFLQSLLWSSPSRNNTLSNVTIYPRSNPNKRRERSTGNCREPS